MITLGKYINGALIAVGLPIVLVAAWWLFTANSTSFYSPPLREILASFGETWFSSPFGSSRFVQDVLPSIMRLTVGFIIAMVVGLVAGVAVGLSRPLRAYAEPVLEFFRAIPPPVLVPVLMLFFGIGSEMKIVVIAAGCLWPILLNTIEGVRGIDPTLRETARSYRLGKRAMLRTLILRSASPQIVTGARQGLSIGIILMVISEMFAASNGLGFSIVQFQRGFQIPEMWSGVILLGLLGVAVSLIFRIITDRVLAWYYGYRQSQHGGA